MKERGGGSVGGRWPRWQKKKKKLCQILLQRLFGRNLDVNAAMQALGVQPTSTARRPQNPKDDDDAWIVPNYQKKQQAKKLQHLLTSSKPMEQEEAERVVNLWNEKLSVEERVRLYLFWLHNYQDRLRESVRDQADEYNQVGMQHRVPLW